MLFKCDNHDNNERQYSSTVQYSATRDPKKTMKIMKALKPRKAMKAMKA